MQGNPRNLGRFQYYRKIVSDENIADPVSHPQIYTDRGIGIIEKEKKSNYTDWHEHQFALRPLFCFHASVFKLLLITTSYW